MTLFTPFTNLNQYIGGMNNWFTPMFSCWSMPSFFNFNSFMPSFNSWGSLFDFSQIFTNAFSSNNFTNFTLPSGSQSSTNSIWNTTKFTFTSSVGDSFTLSNSNKKNFSLANYNSKAGEKLASTALRNSKGFTGYCATYVKKAIQQTGLGAYEQGHAYEMTGILRRNKNFKEISASNVNLKSLPAGCILVYNKGAQGYSSEYGHTEITTGDGRAVSDGITTNLHKTPSAIFVPVTA